MSFRKYHMSFLCPMIAYLTQNYHYANQYFSLLFLALIYPAFICDATKFLGFHAKNGNFPSIVLIRFINETPLCGGVLVETKHVVSSAKCFPEHAKVDISDLEVLAGEVHDGADFFGPTRQIRNISHIVRHSSEAGGYDIIVLRLRHEFTRSIFLLPIPMATFNITYGAECFLVSWSKKIFEPDEYRLRFTTLSIIQNRKGCSFAEHTLFCAGKPFEMRDIFGSTGSSLICNKTLYGIYLGPHPINHTKPANFANMYNLREWVLSVILWNGTGDIPKPVFSKVSAISLARKLMPSFRSLMLILAVIYIY